MRTAGLVAAGLIIVAVLVVAGIATPPLARTCAATMGGERCAESVTAALARGLPPIHPLILAAHVEPGPAAHAAALGHRATVTFELFGVPGPTSVRLYLDLGGHWGGEVDRSDGELAAWTIAPLLVAFGAAVVLVGLRARRRRATRGPMPAARSR
jgi:hypothetical protein